MVEIAVLAHGRAARVDKAAEFAAKSVVVQVLEVGIQAGLGGGVMDPLEFLNTVPYRNLFMEIKFL